MEDNQQIAEILEEAKSYSIKGNVIKTVKLYLKEDRKLSKVEAYNMAFDTEMELINLSNEMVDD